MKSQALSIASGISDPGNRMNCLREYLQAFTLRCLHECEAFQCLSFVGGTALRFIYDLPRFSEDLDFSLEDSDGYRPEIWLGKLKRDLTFAGFEPAVTWNDRKTVHTAWVRIAHLLKECGLSPLGEQKLSIKLEIDTRPPAGAATESRVINRHFLMAIRHHDLPSLMAGKIHALCTRRYPKGRDWYDLLWYRARVPPVAPNLHLLEAALAQVGPQSIGAATWQKVVMQRLESLDPAIMRDDVAPLLERSADAQLLTSEHIARAVESG